MASVMQHVHKRSSAAPLFGKSDASLSIENMRLEQK